ncbi:hypothetical protein SAMN05421677_11662 [Halobacillus aidingensis]|uniref:Uncharacterized protein n=1 Tax=Halobacillus aidingensis TaxID=240303 RepID=A0A1H0RX68_HALAD|nr:hypothetical protein SAMN05421677_11662 [Halobacillus aidingensis]
MIHSPHSYELTSSSGFENLPWQKGEGEWRDSCGKKVLGETPQDAVRGGSPRSRGKQAIPRSPTHSTKVSKLNLPQSGAFLEEWDAYKIGDNSLETASLKRIHFVLD